MTKRIPIKEAEPEALKAMLQFEAYIKTIQVPTLLRELIKIRASQINACAYCIDMHTEEALSQGESARRIFALPAWKESHLFTDKERAALQLTEEVTLISVAGVSDDTYQKATQLFGEKIVAQIIMQIVVINCWNRMNVSAPTIYKE